MVLSGRSVISAVVLSGISCLFFAVHFRFWLCIFVFPHCLLRSSGFSSDSGLFSVGLTRFFFGLFSTVLAGFNVVLGSQIPYGLWSLLCLCLVSHLWFSMNFSVFPVWVSLDSQIPYGLWSFFVFLWYLVCGSLWIFLFSLYSGLLIDFIGFSLDF